MTCPPADLQVEVRNRIAVQCHARRVVEAPVPSERDEQAAERVSSRPPAIQPSSPPIHRPDECRDSRSESRHPMPGRAGDEEGWC